MPTSRTLVTTWRELRRAAAASCRAISTRCARRATQANEKMAKLDKKSDEFAVARDGDEGARDGKIKEGEAELDQARARCASTACS